MLLFRTRLSLLVVLLTLLFMAACSSPTAPSVGPGCKEHGVYPGGTIEAHASLCPLHLVSEDGTWWADPNNTVTDAQGNVWIVYYQIEFDRTGGT